MIYVFKHPKKEKYIEVNQGMMEDHVYFDEKGLQWERILIPPTVAVKEKIDPFKPQDFVRVTGSQKGTYGDILDRSKELSEKRKDIMGVDPIERKYFQDYSAKRKGKKHPKDPSVRTIEKGGVSISFD